MKRKSTGELEICNHVGASYKVHQCTVNGFLFVCLFLMKPRMQLKRLLAGHGDSWLIPTTWECEAGGLEVGGGLGSLVSACLKKGGWAAVGLQLTAEVLGSILSTCKSK